MNDFSELLRRLVDALDDAKIPFMIAGSFASTAHGLPRATQDLDIVIDPPGPDALDALLARFPPDDYYVDSDAAHDALRRRAMFNVIDNATGWKLDLIVRKNRPFSREEFRRRQPLTLLDVPVFVASPEDTVIAKLEWSHGGGGSERQRRDVVGILETMADRIDTGYIEKWVLDLGVEEEWLATKSMVPT
jgi:hypothetical protein